VLARNGLVSAEKQEHKRLYKRWQRSARPLAEHDGRKQEDGPGQIHLPGQALHLAVAERRPVFEHRQLVPLQRRVSKFIDDHVRQ
jgi:hypothetical protein